MEGIIVNFRTSRHRQNGRQMVIYLPGVESREKAAPFVGKNVTWTNAQGTAIHGKISGVHGNSGAVRTIFERGLPGQSVGMKVKIE